MNDRIRAAVARHLGKTQRFLCELIANPSLSGEEGPAMEFAESRFASVGQVLRVPLSDTLRQDRDFSDPVPGLDYQNRNNLRLVMRGADGGRTLLLNTHLDTVPPSCGQERPYDPQVRDGAVFGRGACDAKGQVATIYLAMSVLQELGLPQKGNLVVHLAAGASGSIERCMTTSRAASGRQSVRSQKPAPCPLRVNHKSCPPNSAALHCEWL